MNEIVRTCARESEVSVVGDHMFATRKGIDAPIADRGVARTQTLIWTTSGGIHGWQARRAVQSQNLEATSRKVFSLEKITGEKFEASYELPFLAHAMTEPMNAHGSLQIGFVRNLDRKTTIGTTQ